MTPEIKLFNTLGRDFTPLKDQKVSVYTCGPTVYLDPHIGNWRTFIFYDTLIRVLRLNNLDVTHVINITDVGHLVSDADDGEDKMTKTAKSLRKTAWEVADHYTKVFLSGIDDLNMLKPSKLPKATDHIAEQIEMIKNIDKAGYCYKTDDGIYFDTAKLSDYGKLRSKSYSANTEFARIDENNQKRNPEDFALWKFSPSNEKRDMEWESPWGIGFPGWHIECSAMAKKYLGDTITIHAGGVDHIPVHHTNEIAQSETANNVEFAKIWMHAEFMKVNATKMSKSLGNYFTLEDVRQKGYSALDFRMLILQGHYRTETNFTWDNLSSAASRQKNIQNALTLRWQLLDDQSFDLSSDINSLKLKFIESLNDDLSTPRALEIISQVCDLSKNGINRSSAQSFIEFFQTADKALGLNLIASTPDINDDIKTLITQRQQARTDKNYQLADQIRDKLHTAGYVVLDGEGRQFWQYA